MCVACSLARLQDRHRQHGGAHDQRHGIQALQRRHCGERQRLVEAGGCVPSRDAHDGGRQLLLLGRLERAALPEGDEVSGERGARPRSNVGAAVVLRTTIWRRGSETAEVELWPRGLQRLLPSLQLFFVEGCNGCYRIPHL